MYVEKTHVHRLKFRFKKLLYNINKSARRDIGINNNDAIGIIIVCRASQDLAARLATLNNELFSPNRENAL